MMERKYRADKYTDQILPAMPAGAKICLQEIFKPISLRGSNIVLKK